jgi:periplasmic divalent cation tolerance protein
MHESIGETYWVYCTAPDQEVARRLARMLVQERLAACVNILGAIESVYRWEGVVRNDAEVAFVAKTHRDALDALILRVVELHPYECAAILALPVADGHRAFLEWIRTETTGERDRTAHGDSDG